MPDAKHRCLHACCAEALRSLMRRRVLPMGASQRGRVCGHRRRGSRAHARDGHAQSAGQVRNSHPGTTRLLGMAGCSAQGTFT